MQKQLLEKENNLGGLTMKKFLKQLLNKRLNNEKGLTLIELLAVIVILAIISAIAIPAIGGIINNSQIKAVKADVANVLNAANIYFTDNTDDDSADESELGPYLQSWGSLSQTSAGDVTVTKGAENSLSITGTISAGGKTITITNATISNLQLDNSNEVTDVFEY